MRSFVVAGLCLLLASSAMAATQVDLVARGIGPVVDTNVDGLNVILDVIITSDQPMSAAGFGFDAPAGVQYAPFVDVYGAWVENYADISGTPPINTAGWSVQSADANLLAGGALDTIPADGSVNEMSTLFGAALATSGLFGWLDVTLVPADAGEYTIDIKGGIADANFQGIPDVRFNPLTVVPESASALLLLLGVPFLRRRR